MKKYLLFFFLIPVIFAFPQINNVSIDISSGLSLPIGKYGGQNLTDGSFTKPGGDVLINFNWLIKAPFGLRASISGSMHPVDVKTLGWYKVGADPFLEDLSIRSDPYLALTAMGGIFYEKELFRKFKIQGGVNAGIMDVKTPYQLHKPKYYLVGPEYYEITAAQDYAFVYQLSLNYEFEIRDGWSLIMHSSFNNAIAEFTFWTANEIRIDKKPISYLLVNLGFRLKL